jgi:HK97 family phage portal protein
VATFQVPGDEMVTVAGFPTGLARPSVPLQLYPGGAGVAMLGDRTVSFWDIYGTQPYVASTINKIVRQVLRLPLKAYKRTEAGRERVNGGYLFDLIRQPWPRASAMDLKQGMLLGALIHGNSLLVKQRRPARSGPVRSLRPVPYPALTPRIIAGEIEAWENTGRLDGLPMWINAGDVLHVAFRGMGPLGVSPLAQLGVTLRIEDAAQRHQQALMLNGARPTGALKQAEEFLRMEGADRQAAQDELRAGIDALYVGPENSGRPLLLPPGIEWQNTQHTAVEAELIQQRELAREEVCAVYDVPPPLVGILEHATLANLEEFNKMMFTAVLAPWLTLVEETIWAQLIAEEPTIRGIDQLYVEFDLADVLRGSLVDRSQAMAAQIATGILTIDEAREIENRPAFDLPLTRAPLYPSNNLTPIGVDAAPPSDAAVVEAADTLAALDHDQVRRVLRAHSSTTDAILALARSNGNGVHEVSD